MAKGVERMYEGGLGLEFEAMLQRIDERKADEARRGIRDWLLAPTLDLYHALQAGEAIPLDLLNRDALKRYGLKKRGVA
jgi:hypothetical protein